MSVPVMPSPMPWATYCPAGIIRAAGELITSAALMAASRLLASVSALPSHPKGTFSEKLLDNFGTPMDEYLRQTEVIETDGYVSMAALTGPSKPEAGMSETNASETSAPKQIGLEDLAEQKLDEIKSPLDEDRPAAEAGGLYV